MTDTNTLSRNPTPTAAIADSPAAEVINQLTNVVPTDNTALVESMFPSMPEPTEAQMQEIAARLRAEVAAVGQRLTGNTISSIKLKGSTGFITEEGGAIKSEVNVVIVAYTNYNALFDTRYSPGNFEVPRCYALNPITEKMAPAANATEPQAASCAVCPQNQFKSADGGRGAGKACRNARRLAVLLVETGNSLDTAELMTIAVPPTSLKAFDRYLVQLASRHSCTPSAVLTKLTLDPSQTYSRLIFTTDRPLTASEVLVAFNWAAVAETTINQPLEAKV